MPIRIKLSLSQLFIIHYLLHIKIKELNLTEKTSPLNPSPSLAAALITMPFAPAEGPSIQLAVLKRCLNNANLQSDEFFLNIRFLKKMRDYNCHNIYNSTLPSMVSEWFFSPVPFSRRKDFFNMTAYSRLEGFAQSAGISPEKVFDIKEKIAPEFIDEVFNETHWGKYSAVCFTLSYAQINASFALAKKIKEKFPQIKTIFGGAFSQIHEDSCPEYMKAFDFIDFFVLGDAEPVIAPLLESIINKTPPPRLPGLFCRESGEVRYSGGVSIAGNIDEMPIPDYRRFFAYYKSLDYSLRSRLRRYMPIEMSRGCPWGQHKPCSFCAFYPCGGYKPKSPEAIEKEIKYQVDTNGSRSLYIVDAAVIPPTIEKAFPLIQGIAKGMNIPFLEVRTTLKEEHVRIMKETGVTLVQPGIEALDDGILKKMNKGVTLFSNLLFLKWCRKYGIGVSYNIILGVPDATVEDLRSQLEVINLVHHLDPPFPMPLSVVRLSDYYHNTEKYPLKNLKPDDFYRYIYPKGIDINKVAFEYSVEFTMDTTPLVPLYQQTMAAVEKWRNTWISGKQPFLKMREREGEIEITDGRNTPQSPVEYILDGLEGEICRLCMNRPRNVESIIKRLPDNFRDTEKEEVAKVLEDFREKGLVISRNNLWLILATEGEK